MARAESPGCTSAIWLSATTQELPMGRSVKPSGAPKLSINHLSRKRVCPFSSLATNDSVAISKLRRSSSTKTFPESFTLQLANRTVHIVRRRDLQQNKPQFSGEEKDGGLYLRIPSFGDQNVESSAVDAIEKHLKSPFIIIDVRGNGGGSTPQGLLAKLMEKPYHIWRESTPDHIGIFRAWGAERENYPGRGRSLQARIGIGVRFICWWMEDAPRLARISSLRSRKHNAQ
jgi:Peptidase family S41